MDAGEGSPEIDTLWLSLAPEEVEKLRDGLTRWLVEVPDDPNWHFHVDDGFGRGLIVDVMKADDPRYPPKIAP